MIEYISKNILVNCGFKFVEHKQVNDKQYDNVFIFEETDYFGDINFKEANYKFNKVFELFKHDIKEIHEQTGTNYVFNKIGEQYIISVVFD